MLTTARGPNHDYMSCEETIEYPNAVASEFAMLKRQATTIPTNIRAYSIEWW